jgi:hypothetical protein
MGKAEENKQLNRHKNCRSFARNELRDLEQQIERLKEWQTHMSQQHDHDSCATCKFIEGYVKGRNEPGNIG